MLAEIVKDSTRAAYVAFTKGYKSKFAYFMRTIDSFEDYVEPMDEVINDIFLPVFCQTEPLPDELKLNESKSKFKLLKELFRFSFSYIRWILNRAPRFLLIQACVSWICLHSVSN